MAGWLASLVGRRFWVTSYLALFIGFTVPAGWLAPATMEALVPVFLGGILFFSGLRLPLTEMLGAIRDASYYRQSLWILPLKLLLIPLVAYGLAVLLLPQWAAGVLVVSLMPMGLSSIAFTDLYGGQRMMAVLLVVATSLMAPISVPLVLAALGYAGEGGFPLLALTERTIYILVLLFLPLIAAQLVRRLLPHPVARYHHAWNGWAIASSCALIFASVVGTRPWWQDMAIGDLVIATLAACLASAVAFVATLSVQRLLPEGRGMALMMGAVFMNNGLAVAFALRFFPGDATVLLPCLLMQFPMVAATVAAGKCAGLPLFRGASSVAERR